jgi:acetyltransferase-like isoleucine patch superfamily enzyme
VTITAKSRESRDFAAFGADSTIGEPMIGVVNASGIRIGAEVEIGAYAFLEALSARDHVVVEIGDGTYIGPFLRLTAVGGVTIGRKVLIADRAYLSDSGHVYEDITRPIRGQGLRTGRRLVIEDGAWVGVGAAIVGNVRIGRNAVVGANAVVTRDVDDFTVVTGNPARVVRRHDGNEWQWTVSPDDR